MVRRLEWTGSIGSGRYSSLIKKVNINSMNIETKLEHFYKPEKMRTAIFKME